MFIISFIYSFYFSYLYFNSSWSSDLRKTSSSDDKRKKCYQAIDRWWFFFSMFLSFSFPSLIVSRQDGDIDLNDWQEWGCELETKNIESITGHLFWSLVQRSIIRVRLYHCLWALQSSTVQGFMHYWWTLSEFIRLRLPQVLGLLNRNTSMKVHKSQSFHEWC